MNSRITEDILIIYPEIDAHYMSREGFQELQDLFACLDDTKKNPHIHGIILWQGFGSSLESFLAFTCKEAPNMLLSGWIHRALAFRNILKSIRTSELPVLWVGTDSCLSSHWELAVSAHWRVWFGEDHRLGFPELELRRMPAGGTLDFQTEPGKAVREAWLKTPVWDLQRARREGLADWLGGSVPEERSIIRWFHKAISRSRNDARKNRKDPPAIIHPLPWDSVQKAGVLNGRIRDPESSSDCFELSIRLVKDKKLAENPDEAHNLMAKWTGKCWLDMPAISRNVSGWPISPKFSRCRNSEAEAVWIDISECTPPAGGIAALLRDGCHLAFFGVRGKDLASTMERIALKLEKLDDKKSLLPLWTHRTAWVSCISIHPEHCCLKWGLGEFLDLQIKAQSFRFLTLSGPQAHSSPGWLEYLSQNHQPLNIGGLQHLLSLISQGVLPGVWLEGQIPVSSWARLMFLQELLAMAGSLRWELGALLNVLHEAGWGFTSSEAHWSRFLQTRQGQYPEHSGILMPDRELWDSARWKHLVASCHKGQNAKKGNKKEWHGVGLSRHFELFSLSLSRYLFNRNPYTSQSNIDQLIAQALGFPEKRGCPQSFADSWGQRRVLAYSEANWPLLQTLQ